MKRFIFLCSAVILVLGCADRFPDDQLPSPQAEKEPVQQEAEEIENLPKFLREETITCASIAEAVNHYVEMGEEKAIQALKALARRKPQGHIADRAERRMAFACRVLFEPKERKSLRGPGFGGLMNLPDNTMPLESWPLFPVAKASSTYFVLSEAYLIAGLAEPSLCYVSYCCAEGKFRTERVPIPTRAVAMKDLEELRSSPAWKSLRWNDRGQGFQWDLSEDRIVEYLKKQAEMIPQ